MPKEGSEEGHRSGPKDEDQSLNWFLKPHEIIALVLTVAIVIYFVFTRDSSNNVENVKAYVPQTSRVAASSIPPSRKSFI